MKVVLCGPPRSGKSCFREGLKKAIRGIPGAPYPYVITACPDGEGAWFQETVNLDPQLAAELKAAYKSRFSAEFVDRVADSVKNCSLPITLVDIGGIPSAENRIICATCSHAILLSGDISRMEEWREFCRNLGITVIAEIYSDYDGAEDAIPVMGKDGVLRGSVHHLERGERLESRKAIKAMAKALVEMAS